MIAVDMMQTYPSGSWCHMWETDGDEAALVEFAKKIGLQPGWIQYGGSQQIPHFDLRASMRQKALENGAVSMTLFEWMRNNGRHAKDTKSGQGGPDQTNYDPDRPERPEGHS